VFTRTSSLLVVLRNRLPLVSNARSRRSWSRSGCPCYGRCMAVPWLIDTSELPAAYKVPLDREDE